MKKITCLFIFILLSACLVSCTFPSNNNTNGGYVQLPSLSFDKCQEAEGSKYVEMYLKDTYELSYQLTLISGLVDIEVDNDVVEINESTVIPKRIGTATVTATLTFNGIKYSDSIKIIVKANPVVEGGKVEITNAIDGVITIKEDETIKVETALTKISGDVEFSLSKDDVISIDEEGNITVLSFGEVNLTAKVLYDGCVYETSVLVKVKKDFVDTNAPEFVKSDSYTDNLEVSWGSTFDPFLDVNVIDEVDGNLNSKTKVSGFNTLEYGEQTVKYEVVDNSGNASEFTRKINVVWNYKTQFIGHAGSYYGLLNSEEAILYAINVLKYQNIEVDIKQTKDGVFVLSHDDDFNGIDIASTNWADLKDVTKTASRNAGFPSKNGSVTNSPYTAKLITLDRFLDICKEYNVRPVIEIKSSQGLVSSDVSRMADLMKIIKDKGMVEKSILLSSTLNCLIWTRNNGYANIECQYLVNSFESENIFNNCVNNDLDISINVTGDHPNSITWLRKYQNAGIKVSTFTFTQYVDYPEVQKWIDLGVDFVTCDWHRMEKLNLNPNPVETYTVKFLDKDGEVISTQVLIKGEDAVAPKAPVVNGYEFEKWDKAFTNVSSNLEVKAIYKMKPNAIIYHYEDGKPVEFPCATLDEFIEVFWNELYAWSGSSLTLSSFKSEALAKWKSGGTYNGALVYKAGANEQELEGYFVSCKANYDRWMPFMVEFDKQVTNINNTQNAWDGTYVGYIRLYALLQKSSSYWNEARVSKIVATMTKRAVLPDTYVSGVSVDIPDLFVNDGRTFLGWYDASGNKVTSISATQTGQVDLYARWSESIKATNFEAVVCDKIYKLDTYKMTWTFTPENTTNKKVKFTSSDPTILSVNEDGILTAYKEGNVTITIEVLDNSSFNKTFNVSVIIDPFLDGSYSDTSIINVGDTTVLNVTQYAINDTIIWTSTNPSIATVNNGVVTGVNSGYTTIIAKCATNPDVSFEFGITVSNNKDQLSLIEDAHNSDTFIRRDLNVAYAYLTDIFVSASDLLFNYDYYENPEFEATQQANSKNHGGKMSSVEFITVHYTAGTPRTSNARNTASYMSNSSDVSIHYTTGNDGIYHCLDNSLVAYHAGDGTGVPFKWIATGVKTTENVKPTFSVVQSSNSSTGYYFTLNGTATTIEVPVDGKSSSGTAMKLKDPATKFTYFGPAWKVVDGEYYMGNTWACFSQTLEGRISSRGGNLNSIGIETACNQGSDLWLTYQITAQLVARLLVRYNLDLSRVVGHNMFSGKDCPQTLLANGGELWEIFMEAVTKEYELLKTMQDYTITCVSNNKDILDDNGRIVKIPRYSTTVSYTVTVTNNLTHETVTQTYSTIVHGQYTE